MDDQTVREDLIQRSSTVDLRPPSEATLPAVPDRRDAEVRFFIGLAALAYVATLTWLALWAVVPSVLLRWQPFLITSGSMAPAIDPGDVVVVQPKFASGLGPGTVITFETTDGVVTHRIVGVDQGRYVTKGDANRAPDSSRVEPDKIIGVGRVLVPLVGLPKLWQQTGNWPVLTLWLTATFLALWLSRYAVDPRFDPWPDQRLARHG